MSYRDVIVSVAMENVYNVVDAFAHGRTTPETLKYYAQLVGDGITGKGID